ncbi:MAG: helix-turn-helix domain protein [Bacteriophage sp.]|nr:MAG: helix-turn-helix domain protein [Bacteriophage sp.]
MNERIKFIRKNLNKTQNDFGILCGKSRRAIAAYEQGAVIPDNSFIQLLCLKFNVNEEWLRTGFGKPFISDDDNLIKEISEKYNLGSLEKQFLINFLELDENDRQTMLQCMSFMINNRKDDEEKTYDEKLQQVADELKVAEKKGTYQASTTTNITNSSTEKRA